MAYPYQLYGLKISSGIKLNQLPLKSFTGKEDVLIKKGKLRRPSKGKPKTLYKPFSIVSNNFFYLDVKGIARYKVAGKNTIIVDKYDKATWREVVLFLLDSVLVCVLILHGKYLLQASAVSFNKQAFLFCGNHGVGKSALAAFLHHKEIKIIEDDKCLLHWDASKKCFFIKNQYPYAALWADVERWKRLSKVKKMKAIRPGIQKYEYDIQPVVEKRKLPVKKIYTLEEVSSLDKINKKEVKGLEKANAIRQFIRMHHLIAPFGKTKSYFKLLSLLSSHVDFIHLERARATSLTKFSNFVRTELHSEAVN